MLPAARTSAAVRRHGAVMLALVPAMLVLLVLMLAFVSNTTESSRATTRRVDLHETRSAAHAVNALAVDVIWSGFLASTHGGPQRAIDFQVYMDGLGIPDQAAVTTPVDNEMLAELDLPTDAAGETVLGDVVVESVRLHRIDEFDGTRLVFTTTAAARRGHRSSSAADARRTIEELFSVEPPAWVGLDFALLANNVDRIMCYTQVDDAWRYYDADPAAYGTFDRVRTGSIETFLSRSDPESAIAGTLYVGGDADGEPVDGVLPSSFPPPFPDDGGYDVALGVPTPEGAGNRVVDQNEFDATVHGSRGTASGGRIGVLPPGETITGAAELAAFTSGGGAGLGGVTRGNVFLHGTADDPIVLDGDLAIDGDLVVSGVVRGEGAIRVRGNVYVRGDLTYLDGEVDGARTFGEGPHGPNLLALTAGKNIVVGDPYHPAWGRGAPADGTEAGSWNFTLDEMAIFNRMEWMRAQPTLPGEPYLDVVGTDEVRYEILQTVSTTTDEPVHERQRTGTREVAVDERVQVGTRPVTRYSQRSYDPPRCRTETVPVWDWVTPQHANAHYDPEHLPRYYRFDESTDVPIYDGEGWYDPVAQIWVAPERAGEWSDEKLTIADPDDLTDPYLYDASGEPIAALTSITPTGDWITDGLLRRLIAEAYDGRDPSEPVTIDATLYCSNSIFGVVPGRNHPGVDGRLQVNGAIVAADIGLLAPEGLRVNYDERGGDVLDVRDDTRLVVRRVLWAPVPQD